MFIERGLRLFMTKRANWTAPAPCVRRREQDQMPTDEAHSKPAEGPDSAPVDRVHLARYTQRDERLEREILDLFVAHVPVTLAALQGPPPTGTGSSPPTRSRDPPPPWARGGSLP